MEFLIVFGLLTIGAFAGYFFCKTTYMKPNGRFIIEETDEKFYYKLDLDVDPEDLKEMDYVLAKIYKIDKSSQ